MTISVGDTVIWRQGKSKSKNVLPFGIDDCTVLDLGVDANDQPVAQLSLPDGIANVMKVDPLQWALVADLEKAQ